MVSACLIGEEVGLTRPADTAAVIDAFERAGFRRLALDERLPIGGMLRLLAWDKKAVDGAARFVLMENRARHARPRRPRGRPPPRPGAAAGAVT